MLEICEIELLRVNGDASQKITDVWVELLDLLMLYLLKSLSLFLSEELYHEFISLWRSLSNLFYEIS